MYRRAVLVTAASGIATVSAGCLGGGDLVDETIDEGMIYDLDLESGSSLTIELVNEAGDAAFVTLRDSDGSVTFTEGTADEDEFTVDITQSGTYRLQVTPDEEASINVVSE